VNGVSLRLQRLFSDDKNTVIVAMDHGKFDGPISGM